jgi:tetratricopeptide (TPR) repeat protein
VATVKQVSPRRTRVVAFIAALLVAGLVAASWSRFNRRAAIIRAAVPSIPELVDWPADFREALARPDAAARGGALAALADLSMLYHANGFFAEAETCYRALQQLEPSEPRWWHRHSAILGGFGDLDAAARHSERAVALAPDYIPARLRLAEVELKRNNFAAASTAYEDVLRRGDHPHALLGLARLDVEHQRWSDAREKLERLVAQTNYALGYDLIVSVYEQLGEKSRAAQIRARAKASGAYSDAPDPWLDSLVAHCFDAYRLTIAAGLAERSGDLATALRHIERAVALAPTDISARFQLARTLQGRREILRARTEFERCTQLAPTFADGWAHLAALLAEIGDRAAAERAVTAGLSHCPESPGLHFMRARFHRQAGRIEPALVAYRRSLQLRPNEAEPYVEIATLLLQHDGADEAVQHLERAFNAEPDHPDVLALLTLTAIARGDDATAQRWLARVREQPRVAPAKAQQLFAAYRGQFGREFK